MQSITPTATKMMTYLSMQCIILPRGTIQATIQSVPTLKYLNEILSSVESGTPFGKWSRYSGEQHENISLGSEWTILFLPFSLQSVLQVQVPEQHKGEHNL